ncbi:MAG TPA: VOC family protein [Microlunatus sp.]
MRQLRTLSALYCWSEALFLEALMQIDTYTISLNVADPKASADFITQHFGFRTLMEIDELSSVGQQDSPFSIVFLKQGLASFKPASQAGPANGLLLAFTVADVDAEYERIVAAGAPVVTPIETEPWGERYFQLEDPNGLILQVVGWVEQPTR